MEYEGLPSMRDPWKAKLANIGQKVDAAVKVELGADTHMWGVVLAGHILHKNVPSQAAAESWAANCRETLRLVLGLPLLGEVSPQESPLSQSK